MAKLAEKLASAQKVSRTGGSKPLEGEPSTSEATRSSVDWERVEAEYRVGTMSLREIGAKHGVTEGAIRKRAKKEEWSRDLAAKVKAKAEELVRKELVRSEVRKESATETETIAVEAKVVARIKLTQRKDVGRARDLATKLLEELEAQTNNVELMQNLGEIMANPDRSGADKKLADAYSKAISLGGRVSTMKALSETLRNLITLEREAYGMNDLPPGNPAGEIGDLSDEELEQRINERIKQSRA